MSGPDLETILEFAREAAAWNLDGISEAGSTKMHMRQVQLVSSALLSLAAESEELRAEKESAENRLTEIYGWRDEVRRGLRCGDCNALLVNQHYYDCSRRTLESHYTALEKASRQVLFEAGGESALTTTGLDWRAWMTARITDAALDELRRILSLTPKEGE